MPVVRTYGVVALLPALDGGRVYGFSRRSCFTPSFGAGFTRRSPFAWKEWFERTLEGLNSLPTHPHDQTWGEMGS